MQAARDQRLVAARDAVGHQHGLGSAGRAVVHRGVGDFHAGQQSDLGLELEEILQSPLRDLRLVRRVGRQELAALDHVVDGRRHMMAIGAGADEERRRARRRQVLGRVGLEGALDLELALMVRQAADLGRQPRRSRHVLEQLVDRLGADDAQHLAAIGLGEGKITHRGLRSRPRLFTSVVARLVHQAGKLALVGELHLEEPAFARGLDVDVARRVGQGGIALDHLAGRRRVDVGGGLHRLDHRDGLALGDLAAGRRHVDEHDVAELLLRILG